MLHFWNNGAPTPADIRGTGSKQRLVMPNGDVLTGAIGPDPDLDLYDYTETGPEPGDYEEAGSKSYANDGWTITATKTVVDVTLGEAKAIHTAKVKDRRDIVIGAGINWAASNGTSYIVETDTDSQSKVSGAVVRINEANLASQAWRMADNQVAVLSAADFKTMALAVGGHVDACYVRQGVLDAAISAANSLAAIKAIDTTTGWPAFYDGGVG